MVEMCVFFSENTLCYLFLLTHESQEIFGLKCMILYDHYLNLVSYITFRLFWVDISCGREVVLHSKLWPTTHPVIAPIQKTLDF